MRSGESRIRVGELRPNQLLHTFGIGSVVDLPYLSVMVMGLNDWQEAYGKTINEDRLLDAVKEELGNQVRDLKAPPLPDDSSAVWYDPLGDAARIGVPVAVFPRWMFCPECRLLARLDSTLFELKTDPYRPEDTCYVHANCGNSRKPPTVLPARFLVACPKGHLDDFPWLEFVHSGKPCSAPRLRFREVGPSGEAVDILVMCEVCEKSKRMAEAFGDVKDPTILRCRGRHPHLRSYDDEECTAQRRTILMGASNSWFPDMLSALSIPVEGDRLAQLVEENWQVLGAATSLEVLRAFREVGNLNALISHTLEDIWAAVQQKRESGERTETGHADLKAPEWEVFSNPDPDRNSSDFRLRVTDVPTQYEDRLDKVVLVERLREVSALIGFTRIDSPEELDTGGGSDGGTRAPLCRQAPRYVPAVENRGEGIFIQFREQAISDWMRKDSVRKWEAEFLQAHGRWRNARNLDPAVGFPTMRYVMLHSLAHALMRQFSLECGYASASMRERIYSATPQDEDGPMAGFLIYTAAPDSEGTLGGLVSLGEARNLGRHLDQALEAMRFCSSDPLCAEHTPYRGDLTLHGATCHGCLFAPETSCERGNKYLDRSVLVPTVQRDDVAFFTQIREPA